MKIIKSFIIVIVAITTLTITLSACKSSAGGSHVCTDWTETGITAATCVTDAVKNFKCANEKCTQTKTETIANSTLAHDDTGAKATCTVAKTCARSGCDYELAPKLQHNATTVGYDAGCDYDGEATVTCADCDFQDAIISPALGHDESGAPATCSTDQVCARAGCNYIIAEATGCDMVRGTLVTPATHLVAATYNFACVNECGETDILPDGEPLSEDVCQCPNCATGRLIAAGILNGTFDGSWQADNEETFPDLAIYGVNSVHLRIALLFSITDSTKINVTAIYIDLPGAPAVTFDATIVDVADGVLVFGSYTLTPTNEFLVDLFERDIFTLTLVDANTIEVTLYAYCNDIELVGGATLENHECDIDGPVTVTFNKF